MLIPSAVLKKPGGGGAPVVGVGLFEGMEVFGGSPSLPTTASWTKIGGASVGIAQSSLNVTQGSFSMQYGSASGGGGLQNAIFYNFSGITNILVDVKPSGVAGTLISFEITDGTLTESTTTVLGSGTATTLTLTPTTVNKALAKLYLRDVGDGSNWYADNIRCT